MKIVFIPHALERMKERKISKELVIETITSPDEVYIGYFGRKVAQKRLNGKLIRVVYEESKDEVVVITVYITSKLTKYGVKNDENLL
ncbi:MAG: Uncharacterized protein XD43_0977 [Thermococcales archaeon 44_46]|uniref:DUF4258 domain-containing protein n=1 Tax=Thermococcus sp. PK TaxID=913025 RepID=UPI0005B26EAE|nr:DUF4258 domain-containing protein [Thermococcus sp. PK]KUJ99353.1 MAG: Uncharacterized protein XD43_0977 [Thermococcales archaeon 44_46]HIH73204.1 DUF4258 domain-containing protein [Thermococcaceae archaeon]